MTDAEIETQEGKKKKKKAKTRQIFGPWSFASEWECLCQKNNCFTRPVTSSRGCRPSFTILILTLQRGCRIGMAVGRQGGSLESKFGYLPCEWLISGGRRTGRCVLPTSSKKKKRKKKKENHRLIQVSLHYSDSVSSNFMQNSLHP